MELFPVVGFFVDVRKLADQRVAGVRGGALVFKRALRKGRRLGEECGFVHTAGLDGERHIHQLHQVPDFVDEALDLLRLGCAGETKVARDLRIAVIRHKLAVLGEGGKLGGLLRVVGDDMRQQHRVCTAVGDVELAAQLMRQRVVDA